MASRTAFFATLVSLVSWTAAGTRTVQDILDMEAKLDFEESEFDLRVIGGRPAEEKEFPWVGALHYNGRFICTSSLITPKVLMTAAHCVVLRGSSPEPAERFNAYVGNINRDGPETEIRFNEVIPHNGYGRGTENDIALLKLTTPVQTSDSVQTICLPSKGANFEDSMAQAMGWGVHQRGGRDPSPVLLTVPEHVPRNSLCRFTYGMMGIPVTDKHVCAGGKNTGVCFGDSGGPLVNLNGSKPRVIGVTSFGSALGCAVRGVPAVFTSTESYSGWIEENIGEDAKDLCYA